MPRHVPVQRTSCGGFCTADKQFLIPDHFELHLVECRRRVAIEMPAVKNDGAAGAHINVELNAAITYLMEHNCTTRVYIEEGVWGQFEETVKEKVLATYDTVYVIPRDD